MKTWRIALALTVLAIVHEGCKGKEKVKEISTSARAEAVQNFSEAEFATQIRDHARAEALLAHAVELNSEEPNYWLQLGASRKRLGNLAGARKAYEKARELAQAAYKRDKKIPDPLFAEMEVCVLLGKPEEARRIYERVIRDHGADPRIQRFVRDHVLDAMLAAPRLKEMSL